MNNALPPPPRPGHSRSYEGAHRPRVRVLTDDGWRGGQLESLTTDEQAVVWVGVTYDGADGMPRSERFSGHQVRSAS